jgi:hypothetical protein
VGHYWWRYQHIFIPIVIIAVAGGAYEVTQISKRKLAKIAIVAALVLTFLWNQTGILMTSKEVYRDAVKNTETVLLDLAVWLKNHTPKGSTIATHDIGAMGYLSDRKIIDLVGLVNPEIRPYYGSVFSGWIVLLSQRNVIDYLKEKKPDYLVIFPNWDRFFHLFTSNNVKFFNKIYSTHPVYAMKYRYVVYQCFWNPSSRQALIRN